MPSVFTKCLKLDCDDMVLDGPDTLANHAKCCAMFVLTLWLSVLAFIVIATAMNNNCLLDVCVFESWSQKSRSIFWNILSSIAMYLWQKITVSVIMWFQMHCFKALEKQFVFESRKVPKLLKNWQKMQCFWKMVPLLRAKILGIVRNIFLRKKFLVGWVEGNILWIPGNSGKTFLHARNHKKKI